MQPARPLALLSSGLLSTKCCEPVIWAWLSPLFFYFRQYTFYLRVRVRGREGVCICVSAGEGHVGVVLVSQYY